MSSEGELIRPERRLERMRRGQVRNVDFRDLWRPLEAVGFELDRIRGSHHVLRHPRVPRPVVLQEVVGQAKAYQVRQVLEVIGSYNRDSGAEP